MKIFDNRKSMLSKTINSISIPIGTVFTGELGRHRRRSGIYLRAYQSLIDLNDPSQTWTVDDEYDTKIYNYQSLEVELIITRNIGA